MTLLDLSSTRKTPNHLVTNMAMSSHPPEFDHFFHGKFGGIPRQDLQVCLELEFLHPIECLLQRPALGDGPVFSHEHGRGIRIFHDRIHQLLGPGRLVSDGRDLVKEEDPFRSQTAFDVLSFHRQGETVQRMAVDDGVLLIGLVMVRILLFTMRTTRKL